MLPGQVYTGRQGEGFATTFNLKSPLVDAQRKQDAAKAKSTAQKEAVGKMDEYNPGETWHYYQGEITKRFEDWKRRGAEIMARNKITDIWTSPNPSAIEWQLEGAKIRSAKENINQYQSEYLKAQDDIRTRGKEYTKEYLDAIGNFPNYSFEELASGQINFPQAEFKAPSNYYNGFIKGLTDNMKTKYGDRMPTKDEILLDMGDFLSAPENEPFAKSAQQIYRDLTPDAKKQYQALAELNNLPEGWMALSMTQLERQFEKPTYSLSEELNEIGKRLKYKEGGTDIEDVSGVTKTVKYRSLANKNQPKLEAESFFAEKTTALDDIGFMSALGVDGMDGKFTMTRSERRQAAVKALEKQIRSQAETEYFSGLDRPGAGGVSNEEMKESFDNWWNDMTMQDSALSEQAARFAFQVVGEGKLGEAVDATMAPPGPWAQGFGKALQLTYDNEGTASKARLELAKTLKESKTEEAKAWMQQNLGTTAPTEDAVVKELERQSAGKVVYYPLSLVNKQVLEKKYQSVVKKTGNPYERMMVPDEAGLFQTKKAVKQPIYK